MQFISKLRRVKPRRGALTLEWILIITVLVIGTIGGLGLVRNAIVLEMQDMANSIQGLQVQPPNDNTNALTIPDGSGVVTPTNNTDNGFVGDANSDF